MAKISTKSLKNINLKIGLSFFTLITFIILGFLLFGGIAYKRIFVKSENNLIYSLTKVLGTSLNRVSFSGKYHSQFLIDEMLSDSEDILYIIVQDSNGHIIASSKKDKISSEFIKNQSTEALNQTINETQTVTSDITCCDGITLKQVTIPYVGSYDRDVIGKIIAGVSTTEIKKSMQSINIILVIVGLITILISSLLIMLITSYYSDPIESMALKFQSILNHAPMSIVIRDHAGNIHDYSKEFIRQFKSDNLSLKPNSNIFSILKEKRELKNLDNQLDDKTNVIKTELRLKDTKKRSYYTVFNFLIDDPDSERKSDLICTLAINIDNQKQVEEELRAVTQISQRAAKAKANFLATMSHEMRTPLTSILGFLSLAQNLSTNKQQRHFLNIATKAGNNLLTLINDVLDYSQVESGKVKLNTEPMNLKEIILDLMDYFKIQAKEKNIRIFLDFSDELSQYYIGDPVRIRQIISNITHNAIKFTHNGHVKIKTQLLKKVGTVHTIRITVSDTGIGLTTDQISKIFDKFFQADTSSSRKYSGSGLGLSICQQLVNLMDGHIDVDSTPGAGTRFTIDLPLKVHEKVKTEKEKHAPVSNVQYLNFTEKKILIVDDDESNRALLKFYLTETNHKVDFATDGIEALEKVKTRDYDVILMDIQMPNMDGIQATKEIRHLEFLEKRTKTPIIAFTANVLKEQLEAYNEVGFSGQLLKPFEKSELLKIINAA